jgi:hypothetical protein
MLSMKQRLFATGIPVFVFALVLAVACTRSNTDNTPQPSTCRYSRIATNVTISSNPPFTASVDVNVGFNATGYVSTVQGTVTGQTINATYAYGLNNQLNTITSSGTTIRQPVYNTAGTLITRVNWAGGAYELLGYDASNRLTSVRAFNASAQPTSRHSYLYVGTTTNVATDSFFTINPSTGVNSISSITSFSNYDTRNGSLRALGTLPYQGNLDATSIATGCAPASDNNPLTVTVSQPATPPASGLTTLTAPLTYQYNISGYPTSATGTLSLSGFNVGSVTNTFTYSGCQ